MSETLLVLAPCPSPLVFSLRHWPVALGEWMGFMWILVREDTAVHGCPVGVVVKPTCLSPQWLCP